MLATFGPSMHLFLWEAIVYVGIMPNWFHCVGKADDQMNNSWVDAEIPAFVPAQFLFCSHLTFVAGNRMKWGGWPQMHTFSEAQREVPFRTLGRLFFILTSFWRTVFSVGSTWPLMVGSLEGLTWEGKEGGCLNDTLWGLPWAWNYTDSFTSSIDIVATIYECSLSALSV